MLGLDLNTFSPQRVAKELTPDKQFGEEFEWFTK